MKNKTVLTITTILAWVTIIIPIILLLSECINSYINGTVHGFNGEKLFGIQAFFDTFSLIILLYLPFTILWFILFIVTIIITVVTIRYYCQNKNMS